MIEIEIGNLIWSISVVFITGVLLGMFIFHRIDIRHEKKINEL